MILEAITFLAIGDSITAGRHLTLDPPPAPWPALLEIQNDAVSGSATWHWDPAQPSYDYELAPGTDLIFILLGTNDANSNWQTPRAVYATRIERFAQRLLSDGAGEIVFLLLPDVTRPDDFPEIQARIEGYRDELRRLCGDPDDAIECGPDLSEVLQPEHYAVGDPVHPNQLGQDAIADAVESYLLPEPSGSVQVAAVLGVLGMLRRQT